MPEPLITFHQVSKSFGQQSIFDEVDLTLYRGEITALIGKSGIGKSVLLKHIIGLLKPDSGEIRFEDKSVSLLNKREKQTLKSRLGYMFQNNALFDSMTIEENIALPLKEKTKLKPDEVRTKVAEKLEQLSLSTEILPKYPSQISGGMQKRVALARALIREPEIVLFDEPTTGLDPIRKMDVFNMIAEYQKKFGFTAIIVSHDLPDIFYLADRILILNDSKIIFQGTPFEVEQSKDPLVKTFINSERILRDGLSGLDPIETLETARNQLALEKKSASLLLCDFANLETINEKYGPITGRIILRTLVENVRKVLDTKDLACRVKANEIVIQLNDKSPDEATALLPKLNEHFKGAKFFSKPTENTQSLDFEIRAAVATDNGNSTLQELLKTARYNLNTLSQLTCNMPGAAA